jgi:hypothetical protein
MNIITCTANGRTLHLGLDMELRASLWYWLRSYYTLTHSVRTVGTTISVVI